MDSETRKEQERAIYNRAQGADRPKYFDFFNRDLYGRLMAYELEPDLQRLGERYLKGRRALILGAGKAEIDLLQRYTDQIWALNISERAASALARQYPGVRSFVGDAEQLDQLSEVPEGDGRFDVIYCKSILHHLHPLDEVIAAIARRLAPGGLLFVAMEPGLYNPFAAFGRKFTPSQDHTPGERPLVFARFRELVQRHFEIEYEQQFFLWSMLVPMLGKHVTKLAPALTPLLHRAMDASLRAERALRGVRPATELYWMMAGVYRVR